VAVETARDNESKFVAPLLDKLHALLFRPQTCAMDKGYDVSRVYAECETRGCHPVVPIRRGTKKDQLVLALRADGSRVAPTIPRHSERFSDLYRGRSAVEHEFGRLKMDYGLAPLRVRGLARVQLHADLVMLARLAQALSRARAALPLPRDFIVVVASRET
jgi:Transposase DDE domain